jgi:hypothetical protein
MKFIYPEILYGLAALAIPVIVHLFNFRKFKKVDFPNVAFLREIKQETQSKSRLRHLLILLSRMLAITAIVFAFAQPYIPVEGGSASGSRKVVSIFLDNSFSMQGESEEGPMLEVARNKALEIVDQFGPSDRFQLLTQDFEARHQRLVSKDEIISLIGEVGISSSSHFMSDIMARQKEALLKGEGDRHLFLVSDFQKSASDLASCVADTSIRTILVPTQSESEQNVYLDSAWFATPVRQLNEPEILFSRSLTSGSETQQNIPVNLSINGLQKAVSTTSVEPGIPVDTVFRFSNTESGWMLGKIHIDDYPVNFDDDYYLSYKVADKIRVLEIKGTDVIRDHLLNLYGEDSFFSFSSVSEGAVNYSDFANYDLIVVNQIVAPSSGLAAELRKFSENGGSIVFIPHAEANPEALNSFLLSMGTGDNTDGTISAEVRVASLDTQHYLYSGIFERTPGNMDLPAMQSYMLLRRSSKSNSRQLMTLNTGDPFLTLYEIGFGRFYIFSGSLSAESGNLAQHAIFPTTMLRIAEYSQPFSPLAYEIGSDEPVELRNVSLTADGVLKIIHTETGREFIPEHRQTGGLTQLFVHGNLSESGHYAVLSGTDTLGYVAFNYPRMESPLEQWSEDDIQDNISAMQLGYSILGESMESISKAVNDLSQGRQLWRSMIILALIFLAVEILLIKFLR